MILLLTITSFILGIVRDLMMAMHLGAGWQTDLFFFALIIPTFFENSIALSFRDALIVYYQQLKEKIYKVAIISWSIVLVITLTLLFLTFFIMTKELWLKLLASVWLVEHYNEVGSVFLLGIMTLPLLFWSYFQAAICNIDKNFVLPMWRTVFFNIIGLAIFLIFDVTTELMLFSLIFGQLLHLILLQVYLRKRIIFSYGILKKYKPKSFLSIFFSLLVVSFTLQFNIAIERMFVSRIEHGALSHLTYAYRIVTVPFVIFSMSIFAIAYSSLSKLYADSHIILFKEKINDIVLVSMVFLTPFSVFLFFSSTEVIKFLLFRGQFLLDDVEQTSFAMKGYALGLPLIMLSLVFSRIFLILGYYRQLIGFMLFSSIVVIFLYMFSVQYGVLGVSVSTSLCSLMQVIMLGIYLVVKNYFTINKKDIFTVIIITASLVLFFKNTIWIGFFELVYAGILSILMVFLILFVVKDFYRVKKSLLRLFN